MSTIGTIYQGDTGKVVGRVETTGDTHIDWETQYDRDWLGDRQAGPCHATLRGVDLVLEPGVRIDLEAAPAWKAIRTGQGIRDLRLHMHDGNPQISLHQYALKKAEALPDLTRLTVSIDARQTFGQSESEAGELRLRVAHDGIKSALVDISLPLTADTRRVDDFFDVVQRLEGLQLTVDEYITADLAYEVLSIWGKQCSTSEATRLLDAYEQQYLRNHRVTAEHLTFNEAQDVKAALGAMDIYARIS